MVYAGLGAAANFAQAFGENEIAAAYREAASEIQTAAEEYLWSDADGRYVRMIRVDKEGVITRDMTIDSALTGLFKFGLVEATSERMRRTMSALEDHLLVKSETGAGALRERLLSPGQQRHRARSWQPVVHLRVLACRVPYRAGEHAR